MKNYEKLGIENTFTLVKNLYSYNYAVDEHTFEFIPCPVDCKGCALHNIACNSHAEVVEWLQQDYVDNFKLSMREYSFLQAFIPSLSEPIYIARDNSGRLFLYTHEPVFISNEFVNEWGIKEGECIHIEENLFPFITWESGKAWTLYELIKLEVDTNDSAE